MQSATLSAGAMLRPTNSHSALSDNADWQAAAPLPIATQELYPAVHQERLYVAGGIAARLKVPYFTDRCFAYDATADSWAEQPSLPQPIHHAALVSNSIRLLLVGGFHGSYSHVWKMRDAVHELTAQGWAARGSLPRPQAEGVLSCAPGGTIHLVSGQSPRGNANARRSDHQEVNDHWMLDPAEWRWRRAAPLPTPRNSATGGWVAGQLVVTGGRTAAGNLAVTEVYDPDSDRWHSARPMPLPQAGTASVVHGQDLIVMGGEIFQPQPEVYKNVWRYRLDTDSWSAMPDLQTPRHGLGAGLLGNRLYAVGGATNPGGSGTADTNEYLTLPL